MTGRHNIANALRCARATRGAVVRASQRHGRNALAVAELRQALRLLAALEARLLEARRRVKHGARREAA